VVETTSFALHRVLVITDVLAFTVPADPAWTTRFSCRIEKGLLTLVIRAVWFYQVDDIKLVPDVFASITYSKVKPLGIRRRLMIILEY